MIRKGTSEAIRELEEMGLQIELLTGDTDASANAIANSIGILKSPAVCCQSKNYLAWINSLISAEQSR